MKNKNLIFTRKERYLIYSTALKLYKGEVKKCISIELDVYFGICFMLESALDELILLGKLDKIYTNNTEDIAYNQTYQFPELKVFKPKGATGFWTSEKNTLFRINILQTCKRQTR